MSKRPLFAKADFESFVKGTSGKDVMSRAGGELSVVLKCSALSNSFKSPLNTCCCSAEKCIVLT